MEVELRDTKRAIRVIRVQEMLVEAVCERHEFCAMMRPFPFLPTYLLLPSILLISVPHFLLDHIARYL